MSDQSAYYVDLTIEATCALEAQPFLESIDNSKTYHIANGLRPALGIYIISTGRVLKTTQQLCQKLEDYIQLISSIPDTDISSESEQALIDYIELSLYAASEHVDDLMNIAKHFYRSSEESKKCKDFKAFEKEIKEHKSFISAVTNKIKHYQNRIRPYYIEYFHDSHHGVFHGYIIESITDGVVGPSPIFHSGDRCFFSTTSLVWEIIVFVLQTSRSLKKFLKLNKQVHGPNKTNHSKALQGAVIAAVRLPMYQLDEDFPLTKILLKLVWDKSSLSETSSFIYGSLSKPWSQSRLFGLGNMRTKFIMDGITKNFRFFGKPRRVSLHTLPPPNL